MESLVEKCKCIAIDIYNELGSGFDEAVYQKAFEVSLRLEGVKYEDLKIVPIYYRGFNIGEGKLDLLVYAGDDRLVVELKAIGSSLSPKEETQVRKYMDLLKLNAGLLINFPQAGRKGNSDAPEMIVIDKKEGKDND